MLKLCAALTLLAFILRVPIESRERLANDTRACRAAVAAHGEASTGARPAGVRSQSGPPSVRDVRSPRLGPVAPGAAPARSPAPATPAPGRARPPPPPWR